MQKAEPEIGIGKAEKKPSLYLTPAQDSGVSTRDSRLEMQVKMRLKTEGWLNIS